MCGGRGWGRAARDGCVKAIDGDDEEAGEKKNKKICDESIGTISVVLFPSTAHASIQACVEGEKLGGWGHGRRRA